MVPNADRLLERYIEGLPLSIKGNVTSSKPVDLHEAIDMAQGLMYQVVQELGENSGDKQKWNGNHYNHNTNNTSNLNPNKRPETARVFTAEQGSYAGKLPHCEKCGRHYIDACPPACYNCGKAGHKDKDYRAPPRLANQRGPGSQGGQGSDVTCFGCGKKGHYKNKCPNNGNQGGGNQIRGNPQNPQNNQRQNQKVSNQASTSTQGGRRAPGRVYSLSKIEAVKNWASLTTPSEIRQFLGLAGYYRRFIEGFSKIAKPMTELTQKNQKFDWGEEQEEAFQLLKQKLCAAPILALPEGSEDFVVYCDASNKRVRVHVSVRPKDLGRSRFTEKLSMAVHKEMLARHDYRWSLSIISDHDSHFTSRVWQSLHKALGTQLDLSTAYHPQTDDFQDFRDSMQAARDRQKSYADKRRRPLEFEVGGGGKIMLLLMGRALEGLMRFGNRGKLNLVLLDL
ncbi:putative reverse transcriptase domain-containing protein [Tanacetum coccineum]